MYRKSKLYHHILIPGVNLRCSDTVAELHCPGGRSWKPYLIVLETAAAATRNFIISQRDYLSPDNLEQQQFVVANGCNFVKAAAL